MKTNFILYVRDQEKSTAFYTAVLGISPCLNVPGMTEFQLSENTVLGLMPEKGIKRLLGSSIEDPEKTNGMARAELYLTVENPLEKMKCSMENGAKLLSEVSLRNWGDEVGYVADLDGHVLAFAKQK